MSDPAATDEDVAEALTVTGYRYTDPVTDPAEPRITAVDPAAMPDTFPAICGDAPTGFGPTAADGGG